MGIGEEDKLLGRISELEEEHQALDSRIADDIHTLDQLTKQRLKKRKLWIKDEISRIHDFLEPDIIA